MACRYESLANEISARSTGVGPLQCGEFLLCRLHKHDMLELDIRADGKLRFVPRRMP